MGKTKTKFIDDSSPVEEEKSKKASKKERAKFEAPEATGEVESAPETGTSDESVSQQTRSEAQENNTKPETSEPSSASHPDERAIQKKPQKPGKAKPRSKKYQEKIADLDKTKSYPLLEAIDLVKKSSYSKFEGSLEVHINTIQTGIRGLVSLPFSSGKKLTILTFGKGAEQSGSDIIGSDEVIEEINKGKINFDLVVTTPEWMPKLAKVARILGPRGLMPNPKNGTITTSADGLKKAVEGFQSGKTEYKTESKAAVIHLAVGKTTQPTEELAANIKTLLQTIGKTRVKKVNLSPTMGPSVKLDLTSL